MNSWDSDADEKTLQELRINFNAEKQREQEAASLKLQLQQGIVGLFIGHSLKVHL